MFYRSRPTVGRCSPKAFIRVRVLGPVPCRISLAVKHFLAKERSRVRLPHTAPYTLLVQLGECLVYTEKVSGSTPSESTINQKYSRQSLLFFI